MAKHQPVVEINGKRYDAATGHRHSDGTAPSPRMVKKTAPPKRSIDGMVYSGQAASKAVRPAKKRAGSRLAASLHKRTVKSQTLSRKGVRRPAVVITRKKHPAAQAPEPAGPIIAAPRIDAKRAKRANLIPMDSKVNRFGLPLQNAPQPAAGTEIKAQPQAPDAAAAPVPEPVPAIMPSMVLSSSHKHLNKLLSSAMESSNAHHRPAVKIRRRKVMPAVSMSVAAILLFGFVSYRNVPNAALKVAAERSGVTASLPAYTPSGFSFNGPIRYSGGQLTINYTSHDNSRRSYEIHIRTTTWNDAALLSDFVSRGGSGYQTQKTTGGTTVYIYDNDKATWLDHGNWYLLDGSARLNADQLGRIAGSFRR